MLANNVHNDIGKTAYAVNKISLVYYIQYFVRLLSRVRVIIHQYKQTNNSIFPSIIHLFFLMFELLWILI